MPTGLNSSLSFWAERAVGLLIIGATLFACFWIAQPLLGVLVWGALIAIVIGPLHQRLAGIRRHRPITAAVLITITMLALVVLPLSLLPASFERAATGISDMTNGWTEVHLPPPPSWLTNVPLVGRKISDNWAAAASDPRSLYAAIKPYVGPAFQWLAASGASLGLAVLQILVSIILAGVFLTRQTGTSSLAHRIASRIGGTSGENLLEVAIRTIRSVAQGVIGTALIQGFLSGVGFAIAGVPFAVGLGVLSFATAMLQLGTWLVWIPTAVWLSYQGETGWALFTAVLGVLINVLDNVIKPLLIGRGAGVPLWIIFIGVIGGILTIGFIGIFIGPLVMAAGFSIVTGWLDDETRLQARPIP